MLRLQDRTLFATVRWMPPNPVMQQVQMRIIVHTKLMQGQSKTSTRQGLILMTKRIRPTRALRIPLISGTKTCTITVITIMLKPTIRRIVLIRMVTIMFTNPALMLPIPMKPMLLTGRKIVMRHLRDRKMLSMAQMWMLTTSRITAAWLVTRMSTTTSRTRITSIIRIQPAMPRPFMMQRLLPTTAITSMK